MEPNYWKVKIIAYLGSHCSRTAYKYSALLLKHYQFISTLLKFMQNTFQCLWENDMIVSGYFKFWLVTVAMYNADRKNQSCIARVK